LEDVQEIYLQDDYGLLIADSGDVGIPTGVHLEPDVYPGDIIVYIVLDMLKTGDCVQVLQLTDIKDLALEHTSGSQRSAYNRRDDKRRRPAFRGGVYNTVAKSTAR
jgi:hypothetical protein